MSSPAVEGIGNKWILSLGFDRPIARHFSWGLEFQPFLRNFSVETGELSVNSLYGNLFVNFKAGFNPGRFVEVLDFLNLYGCLGVGPRLSLDIVNHKNENWSSFEISFAWHLCFGIESDLDALLDRELASMCDSDVVCYNIRTGIPICIARYVI